MSTCETPLGILRELGRLRRRTEVSKLCRFEAISLMPNSDAEVNVTSFASKRLVNLEIFVGFSLYPLVVVIS